MYLFTATKNKVKSRRPQLRCCEQNDESKCKHPDEDFSENFYVYSIIETKSMLIFTFGMVSDNKHPQVEDS